jgi:hypothetical protein
MLVPKMATAISATKEKRELVDRVSNSQTFQRSPRLREFLLYVADCTINERLEDAREQQIAANVFNRKPDYNPGQDNIVRVEARSLRKRLDLYFAAEGKDEPIVISMPKGSYSICFEVRTPEFAAAREVEISYPAETALSKPPERASWLTGVFWVVMVVLAGIGGALWRSKAPEKGVPRPSAALILPFSALIEATKDTYIVTSDSSLVLVQDLRRRQISLEDYITGHYMEDTDAPGSDPARQDLIRLLLKRRYTNAAETAIAGRIIQRNSWASQRMLLRSGHGVQLSDFRNHNAILFGSPTSNPWARLFSEKLNFQFEWDQARRGLFRNRSPRAGEQSFYSMTTNPGESGRAYATVSFVPNLNGEGHVLLVAGTTAEGTEAAGEFITDEKRAAAALKAIGIDPAGPPRYFEILLEARAIAGSASQSTILASRLISDTR